MMTVTFIFWEPKTLINFNEKISALNSSSIKDFSAKIVKIIDSAFVDV